MAALFAWADCYAALGRKGREAAPAPGQRARGAGVAGRRKPHGGPGRTNTLRRNRAAGGLAPPRAPRRAAHGDSPRRPCAAEARPNGAGCALRPEYLDAPSGGTARPRKAAPRSAARTAPASRAERGRASGKARAAPRTAPRTNRKPRTAPSRGAGRGAEAGTPPECLHSGE